MEPGSAAPLDLSKHPGALLSVVGCGRFPLESRKRRYSPGELGDCGIGFVSVLCFVVLSFTCSPIAVDVITYTLFVVSAKYSMVQ